MAKGDTVMLSWFSRACLYFSYAALILLGHCKEWYERLFGEKKTNASAKKVRFHYPLIIGYFLLVYYCTHPVPFGSSGICPSYLRLRIILHS